MSEYKDFVQDFPTRCGEILTTLTPAAKTEGREVTLLLMAACAGLVVPYERLQDRHPSGDRRARPRAQQALSKLLGASFGSKDVAGVGAAAWRMGRTPALRGLPDAWQGFDETWPAGREGAGTVVGALRNALAHGNIWSLGNPVGELVFASDDRRAGSGYLFLCTSPAAFETFLLSWFKALQAGGITPAAASDALAKAA